MIWAPTRGVIPPQRSTSQDGMLGATGVSCSKKPPLEFASVVFRCQLASILAGLHLGMAWGCNLGLPQRSSEGIPRAMAEWSACPSWAHHPRGGVPRRREGGFWQYPWRRGGGSGCLCGRPWRLQADVLVHQHRSPRRAPPRGGGRRPGQRCAVRPQRSQCLGPQTHERAIVWVDMSHDMTFVQLSNPPLTEVAGPVPSFQIIDNPEIESLGQKKTIS